MNVNISVFIKILIALSVIPILVWIISGVFKKNLSVATTKELTHKSIDRWKLGANCVLFGGIVVLLFMFIFFWGGDYIMGMLGATIIIPVLVVMGISLYIFIRNLLLLLRDSVR